MNQCMDTIMSMVERHCATISGMTHCKYRSRSQHNSRFYGRNIKKDQTTKNGENEQKKKGASDGKVYFVELGAAGPCVDVVTF